MRGFTGALKVMEKLFVATQGRSVVFIVPSVGLLKGELIKGLAH